MRLRVHRLAHPRTSRHPRGVSDEECRRLEHEALANPTDVAAGWRHVRALERHGDRRGYLAAVGRIARLADREALAVVSRERIALPSRGPERDRARRCEPVRAPCQVRSASVDVPHQARVLAATERALYLMNDEALVAVDTVRLTELWRRPGSHFLPSAFTLRGEDVLLGDGSDLLLLDGDTGAERARERQRGPVTELIADVDRAVALVGANGGRLWLLAGLDIGASFGRSLWKRIHAPSPPTPNTLRGILLGAALIRPRTALNLETGSLDTKASDRARFLDHHGEPELRPRFEAHFDGWRIGVAQDPLTSQTIYDPTALEITSPDGARRRVEVPPLRAPSRPAVRFVRGYASVSIAGGIGYVVSSPQAMIASSGGEPAAEDRNVMNIQVVDLAAARISLDVGVPVDLHGEFHDIQGIALDGALLVVVTTPGGCTLIRLESSRA